LLFFLQEIVVFAECINEPNERKLVIKTEGRDETASKEIFETLLAIDEADDLQVSINEVDFVEVKKLKEKIYKNNTEIDGVEGNTLQVNEFNILSGKKKEESVSGPSAIKKEIKIFVSYSSKDRDIRELLVSGLNEHLADRSSFNFNLWSDKEINLGADWKENIDNALKQSEAAIFIGKRQLCRIFFHTHK
jgi:hypothetical protein